MLGEVLISFLSLLSAGFVQHPLISPSGPEVFITLALVVAPGLPYLILLYSVVLCAMQVSCWNLDG